MDAGTLESTPAGLSLKVYGGGGTPRDANWASISRLDQHLATLLDFGCASDRD